MTSELLLTIAAPIVAAVLAGMGYLLKKKTERVNELLSELDGLKREIYTELISAYTLIFSKKYENGQFRVINQDEIVEIIFKSQEFARRATLIASDDVLRKYTELYRTLLSARNDASRPEVLVRKQLEVLADLISAMRKELGHKPHQISADRIARMFITDYEDSFN